MYIHVIHNGSFLKQNTSRKYLGNRNIAKDWIGLRRPDSSTESNNDDKTNQFKIVHTDRVFRVLLVLSNAAENLKKKLKSK